MYQTFTYTEWKIHQWWNMRAFCHVFEWFWYFPLYFPSAFTHAHMHNHVSSHLPFPKFYTLSKCCAVVCNRLSASLGTIHIPRIKDDSKYYYSSACVGLFWRVYLCFSTCAIFSGKGEIKSTSITQFPARQWKVKVYI